MAVTRDFNELVQKRVARDPAFAGELLRKGIDTILAGDVDTGKGSCVIISRQRLALRRLGRRPALAHIVRRHKKSSSRQPASQNR